MMNIAIIGCGKRAHIHAQAIQQDPRCQVTALVDINLEACESLNHTFGWHAKIYKDLRQMLQSESPDLAIICLWTPLHADAFQLCAEAGVRAVLSEKPMAPSWGESLRMAELAEKHGCQLTFSHQRRFAAGNIRVRRWIKEGLLGEIQRMDLYSPRNLLDCGTHTLDQALSFNGESPGKWVLGAVDVTETHELFGIPGEMLAIGTIVFENGVRANLQVGGPDMDLWGGVRVIGSKGIVAVTWNGELREATRFDHPTWSPGVVEDSNTDHVAGTLRDALDGLETGVEPETSYKKALRAAEIIFGLYESVRRHAKIEFPLTGFEDNPLITMLATGHFNS